MPAVLMDSMPVTRTDACFSRPLAPAIRKPARARRAPASALATIRTLPEIPPSRFAACVRRCEAAGFRLVVTAPVHATAFSAALKYFPERQVDVGEHEKWDAAYHAFNRDGRQPHANGSWRIMVADRDDRVVGAITARFFCDEIKREYQHLPELLETTGPVFREHCELAIEGVVNASLRSGRTPAEVSHWAVAPGWHAALVAVTLMRAMGALAQAFDAPVVMLAGDNRRGEVTRLMRLGCEPLGLDGRWCLPPFVHHRTGAWLRLLLADAATFHARSGSVPSADLALLRECAPLISPV